MNAKKLRALWHWLVAPQRLTGEHKSRTIYLDGAVIQGAVFIECDYIYFGLFGFEC